MCAATSVCVGGGGRRGGGCLVAVCVCVCVRACACMMCAARVRWWGAMDEHTQPPGACMCACVWEGGFYRDTPWALIHAAISG